MWYLISITIIVAYFSQRWSAEHEAAAARGLHPHHPLRLQPDLTGSHGGQGGTEGRRASLEQQTLQRSWVSPLLLLPPPPPLRPGHLSVLEKISNPGFYQSKIYSLCLSVCL